MDENIVWVNEKKIERTMKAIESNNMKSYLVNDNKELIAKIEEIIKKGDTVGLGGSMTLFETGIIDYLKCGKYNLLDRYKEGLTREELKEQHRQCFLADAYFTSSNAITENGELYNVDGQGNRVAAMLYGPDKVIVIAGVNKIVKNVEEAIKRNKTISAPANVKRLNKETPCKITGYCMDCKSPGRICCEYTLIKRQMVANRIHVIFLNENFGY